MPVTRDLFIGGKDVPAASGRTTDDIDPYTGAVYATVAAAGPDDVRRAVDAADAAFDAWAALDPFARRAIFLRAADLLDARGDRVAALMARETGATRPWAHFNVALGANILREAAAAITTPRGEVLSAQEPGALGLAVREPLGVVAAFAPWNAPVILGVRAVAAPLAAGNTVVVKAGEDAPLACGLLVADVLREAGLPDGVLNVITNAPADAAEIATALISDDRVRAVNFTGSTAVGRIVGELAARHLKPAVLELGGKNAIVVLADADVDHAVDAACFGVFMNAGQICMSGDRILVHESLAEEFSAKFAAKVATLPAGDPADPRTVVGPLVTASAARRVAGLVGDAVGKGATVLVGGGDPVGAVHPATVLTDVPDSAELHRTEAFGPLCVLAAFPDDDAAVAAANDTENGLTCGIITENATHGLAVARRVRTGIVHINDQTVGDEPQAPFGGVKASGYGRFGGRWGIEAFSSTRWVTIATRHAHYPF
ncbi:MULTISPECIES: aldehyde dehydrogenase family protein [Streptomyces]|uniref:Aldehyde dehydrogenase family protein n=1 Tax=Streptomyces doudnae TaxID=3075536 RepID=A0ABD5EGU5_9ACTN|nr:MULTISPECIES: aldehyde dehydrogenase family protein [unclassified Streptomyces]MDT0433806.1 aldehyde dehydrogenase family protein [Streptomyces sp. DSM 41981]MYQ62921.1 aldehyde dehydrogenase family protein [Streptomyces sp. SID4950]SCD47014.1 vanillin dehydrogenase [Streptomyces sp. SolWspMP-5a-2]